MPGADFNDLHVSEGLTAVAAQLNAAIEKARAVEYSPAPPSHGDAAGEFSNDAVAPADVVPTDASEMTIDDAVKRFALIFPSGDVWDTHNQCKLKIAAFKRLTGKKVGQEWLDSGVKRQVNEDDILAAVLAAKKRGVQGLDRALERFVYLEPSKEVWDRELREVITIDQVRCVIPAAFDFWNTSPDRQMVLRKNVVFDPSQRVDPDTYINMFQGLPLQPVPDDDACRGIRALLWSLVNEDDHVWTWITRWLAYPLQHVGAKLRTAILMHSEMQGSGKSLFFEGVMRPIYGRYAATLGQHQMESQYTDWQSNLLFGLFEEIFSRSNKYSQMGTIKQMITGEKTRIEKKFMSGWEEANHMNAVFLSNELQPFPVETTDRRFLVIWPDRKIDPDLKARVSYELKHGGIEAFYAWLLRVDLGDFDRYTEAPMTKAKERLIEFGLPSWEIFYREWTAGNLDAPYHSCLSDDLFLVYDAWCKAGHERTMSREKFSNAMAVRLKRRSSLKYDDPGGAGKKAKKDRKGTFFLIFDKPEKKTQSEWLSDCVRNFRDKADLSGVPSEQA